MRETSGILYVSPQNNHITSHKNIIGLYSAECLKRLHYPAGIKWDQSVKMRQNYVVMQTALLLAGATC